jgi:hypothetical protein
MKDDLIERLQQLLDEMELWAAHPTLAIERLFEQFHCETGLLAPGKDVPAAMAAAQPDEAQRQRMYETWHQQRRDQRHDTLREVISVLEGLREARDRG